MPGLDGQGMDRKIKKQKWPPQRIATYAGGTLLAVAMIYFFGFGDNYSKLNVERQKITVSTVSEGPFQEFIPVSGTVLPIRTIYLDAVEGGKVDTIYRLAGSFVQEGDKILRLQNTALHIQISGQEAQVAEQRNLLTNTRFNFDRNRNESRQLLIDREYEVRRLKRVFDRQSELYGKNLISKEEYEQSKDDHDFAYRRYQLNLESHKRDSAFQVIQLQQLGNSLGRLEENLRIAQKRLEELIIRAPIAGQLTSLNAEIGESKSSGERLGQIDVLDGFKIRASIDEHYIARIGLDQFGNFDFAGNTYQLVTQKIYPEVANGRFEVDMEFTGISPAEIRRGQTVRVRLDLGDLTEAIMLPIGGFFQKTGGNWVYVVSDDEANAIKRTIKLGRKNSRVYEVLEGLSAGEKVVTSSYDNFGDMEMLVFH